MKKNLLPILLAGLFFYVNPAFAKHIDVNTAKQVAQNYLFQNVQVTAGLSLNLATSGKSLKVNGIDNYYVFDIQGGAGFIIISAEDAGLPIIGYSTEAPYVAPTASSNPNLHYWMERRREEIEYMRDHNVTADAAVADVWNRFSSNVYKFIPPSTMSVGPLCSTTWNQSGGGATPYNSLCPGGSVTGCVATAMAQIMRKWAYPTNGIGSSSYTHPTYGLLSVNYASATYNWASMPNGSSNSDVALIQYHCGVSVNMDYSPSGSGAYVTGGSPSAQYAFVNYFGYASSINAKYRASDPAWVQDLKTEFDNGRPVEYFGYTAGYASGHAWVGDGYDNSDNIHMNWGWGGFANGYYAVNNLAPTGSGYDFSNGDGALLGIVPAVSNTQIVPSHCGITLSAMDQYVNCSYITGASNYRYRVSHPATGFSVVYTKGTYHNYFQMSNVPGIGYSKTYNVEVAAYKNGVWGSYGSICTLTTPAIGTVQLVPGHCGATLTSMQQYINCTYIPAATDYRYRIINGGSGFSTVYTKGTYHNYFQMSNVPGVKYGLTYTVEVAAYVGGVWGAYGPMCNLTTPVLPTTSLIAGHCGSTLTNMQQYINCTYIPGATDYRYRIINGGSGFSTVYTKGTYHNYFQMSNVPGVKYGLTYTVEVAAYISGAWGAYGAMCNLTTPVLPTTSLIAGHCGSTLTNMQQYINCTYIPGATDYRYRIINGGSGFSTVYTKGTYHNYFQMSNVPGVKYGLTYTVEVAAYISGAWGAYGAMCNLTTPALPTTGLIASHCGITLASMSQYINSTFIHGATGYEYRIVHPATSFTTTVTKFSYQTYIQMSAVPGVTAAKTYNVNVRLYIDGAWGSYGPTCTITTPMGGSAPGPDDRNQEKENTGYSLLVGPNPVLENEISLSLQGVEVSGDMLIEITNILGENMNAAQIGYSPGDVITFPIGDNCRSGIYFVSVIVNNEKFYQKFIVKR